MQENDLLYQIALTQIPNIGSVQAKILVEHLGSAETIFKAKKKELSALEGIGEVRANQIKNFTQFQLAEDEIKFIGKHHIQPLFITSPNYPQRLLHCYDAPTMLYYRGNANLNETKVISIIGTRTNSNYGKEITEQLVQGLQAYNVVIVSGLAFGIDAIAHKAAIASGLPTVAVLAHGLHTIYPTQHKSMAKEMLSNGGLLTELTNGTKPDKHNFPKRNRIVAGMADATIVIETAAKGGSMITAELAYNYNRDLFAVPAKLTDIKSSGCLKLIQQNKAVLYTGVEDFLQSMGWAATKQKQKIQKELFVQLTVDEQIVYNLIASKTSIHIDELYLQSGLSSSTVAACILNLELNNCIDSLPGKLYVVK
jgi:DNA processing protein